MLRGARKLLNMAAFEGAGCACSDVRKESLSHADDSEEESQEDDIEGRSEAEGRDEEKEEVSNARAYLGDRKVAGHRVLEPLSQNSSARAARPCRPLPPPRLIGYTTCEP